MLEEVIKRLYLRLTCELNLANWRLLTPPVFGMYILSAVPTAGGIVKDTALREQYVVETILTVDATEAH